MTQIKLDAPKIPQLRFPEFVWEWKEKRFWKEFHFVNTNSLSRSELTFEKQRIKNIHYGDIHTKLFSSFDSSKQELPYIKESAVPNNIENFFCKEWDLIIADASEDYKDIWKTIEIVNVWEDKIVWWLHTFIARPNYETWIGFFANYMKFEKLHKKIKIIANWTKVLGISKNNISEVLINLPVVLEQKKIAKFLIDVDSRIENFKTKKKKIEEYKKWVTQKIFSQEIRFKDENGNDFPDWEEKKFSDVLTEHKERNKEWQVTEVMSVAKTKGVINQIEHLWRSYAADDVSNYKIINPWDIVYTKSPTSLFPFGIIKQNLLDRSWLVSPLYGVFRPETKYLWFILHNYFLSWVNTYNYLIPIVEKGAKNTMNITNDTFLNGAKIYLPVDEDEQKKIAEFIIEIDKKIEKETLRIEKAEKWKRGLLQKMFI